MTRHVDFTAVPASATWMVVLWTLASAGGIALGGQCAYWLVPEAAAGRNPVGNYGPHVYAYAALIGAGMGLAQAAALCALLHAAPMRVSPLRVTVTCALWFIATLVGVAVMLLPLWSKDLMELLLPHVLIPLLVPGLILLGLTQWLLIQSFGVELPSWMGRTVGGGLIGTFAVLPVTVVVGGLLEGVLSFDAVALAAQGLGIGFLQSFAARRAFVPLEVDRGPAHEPPSAAPRRPT